MLVRFFLSRNYARNPWDLQYVISYFRCNRRPLTRAGRYVLTWLLDHLLPKGPSKWELRKELKLSLEKGPRNVVRPYCAEYEFPYLDVHDGAKQFFFCWCWCCGVVTLMIYRRCNTFTRTAMPMSTVGDKATEPSHRQSNASKNFTNTFGQQPERITDSNLCK